MNTIRATTAPSLPSLSLTGGSDSVINKLGSKTVYKTVLIQTDQSGLTTVIDLRDGHTYYSGVNQSRISNNGMMHKTKSGALGEKMNSSLKVSVSAVM